MKYRGWVVEMWREIPGTDGVYLASNMGRIRKLAHVSNKGTKCKEKMLKATANGDGHLQVGIFGRLHTVHSLVLRAWVGERPKGAVVRHLNDDPSDNRICNLVYGTQKENCADRDAGGWRGRSSERAKIIAERLSRRLGDWTYAEMSELAQEFSISAKSVRRIHDAVKLGTLPPSCLKEV